MGRSFGMPWANPGRIIGEGPLGLAVSALLLAPAFDDGRPKVNVEFSYKLNMYIYYNTSNSFLENFDTISKIGYKNTFISYSFEFKT